MVSSTHDELAFVVNAAVPSLSLTHPLADDVADHSTAVAG